MDDGRPKVTRRAAVRAEADEAPVGEDRKPARRGRRGGAGRRKVDGAAGETPESAPEAEAPAAERTAPVRRTRTPRPVEAALAAVAEP
ncbi:MAG: hypothetical protein Q8M79_07885, partial [Dehalococcoidia bacterium]|nr:hypothetical protein [Dehalococcoidia bacterium]